MTVGGLWIEAGPTVARIYRDIAQMRKAVADTTRNRAEPCRIEGCFPTRRVGGIGVGDHVTLDALATDEHTGIQVHAHRYEVTRLPLVADVPHVASHRIDGEVDAYETRNRSGRRAGCIHDPIGSQHS